MKVEVDDGHAAPKRQGVKVRNVSAAWRSKLVNRQVSCRSITRLKIFDRSYTTSPKGKKETLCSNETRVFFPSTADGVANHI